MKVDAEGNLFCTGPGGVHVFAPNGQILGVIRVPEVAGNFNWGDGDRRTLYICATSSLYSCGTLVPGPAAALARSSIGTGALLANLARPCCRSRLAEDDDDRDSSE
jgi:hypothetical protein